jgi:hypothetical protein
MTAMSSPCEEFQGHRNAGGYGRLSRGGRLWLAHRWAWTQVYGPIPDGVKVLHACDNPPCTNVDHLWLGSQRDNIADRVRKGRSARGERSNFARLTDADVAEIRRRRAAGEKLRTIARDFGTGVSYTCQVARGRARP